MIKEKISMDGKNYYLLGVDGDGVKYYLEVTPFDLENKQDVANWQTALYVVTSEHAILPYFNAVFHFFVESPLTETEEKNLTDAISKLEIATATALFLAKTKPHDRKAIKKAWLNADRVSAEMNSLLAG